MSDPLASIIIPTRNGAKTLEKVLPAVFSQRSNEPFEVLIVDSESNDGTPELVKQFDVRFFPIRKKDFNHGATRQWAAEQAKGKYVLFLTQDATPVNEHWFSSLISAIESEKGAVGAYSRQIPYPDCHPMDADGILQWFGPDRKIYYLDGIHWENLSPMERRLSANFDDVSSCIHRETLLKYPFQPVPYGEDLEWAKRILKQGMKLVYEPSSIAHHSHRRSPLYEFKRRYVDHKMNKVYYGIELFRDWKEVRNGIVYEWQKNYQKIQQMTGSSFTKKTQLMVERAAVTVAQVLGTYSGARSIRYGESLKLSQFERWFTRGV